MVLAKRKGSITSNEHCCSVAAYHNNPLNWFAQVASPELQSSMSDIALMVVCAYVLLGQQVVGLISAGVSAAGACFGDIAVSTIGWHFPGSRTSCIWPAMVLLFMSAPVYAAHIIAAGWFWLVLQIIRFSAWIFR